MPQPEDRVQWLIKKLLPKSIKHHARNAWQLRSSDFVVVSHPKCGRTWLRAALTFYFEARFGLDDPPLLEFANLHYLDRRIPKIYFTHDTLNGDATVRTGAATADVSRYRGKPLMLLVRDPRDVCVSLYFHRARRDRSLETPIFDFVTGRDGGLRSAIDFMNAWVAALAELPGSICLAYEEMHRAPGQALGRVLRFLDQEPDASALEVAVERSRFAALQSLERRGAFASGRLKARDASDADALKVRRGKVGGYVDYFDGDQLRVLDEIVATSLCERLASRLPSR